MNSERLETLLSYYEKDKEDPFIQYAIALEYMKSGSPKTTEWFEHLLNEFPEYLPTYYQAGKFYQDLENFTIAKSILEKGLELAKKQQNQLTAREISNALSEIEFEEDN